MRQALRYVFSYLLDVLPNQQRRVNPTVSQHCFNRMLNEASAGIAYSSSKDTDWSSIGRSRSDGGTLELLLLYVTVCETNPHVHTSDGFCHPREHAVIIHSV